MDSTWTHRGLDLHLTADLHRDLITASSDEASSDGRDISRFSFSHLGDTQTSLNRLIAIGRWTIDEGETPSQPWSGLILQSRSSTRLDLHRTVDRASRRTTIDARSWLDCCAIVTPSARDREGIKRISRKISSSS